MASPTAPINSRREPVARVRRNALPVTTHTLPMSTNAIIAFAIIGFIGKREAILCQLTLFNYLVYHVRPLPRFPRSVARAAQRAPIRRRQARCAGAAEDADNGHSF